jgi:hypothetical protein
MRRSLSVCLLLVSLRDAAQIVGVRGVARANWAKYLDAELFKCHDREIPKDRINDNFCDCVDGSDEPGTSACAGRGASFFCNNLGGESKLLFTSRINDGICDCCDGSDEYDGKITCPDACEFGGGDSDRLLKLQTGAQSRKQYTEDFLKAVNAGNVPAPQLFGKDGAYYGLRDQCFKIKSGVFTYNMCPFSKASQNEKDKETSLGNWKGFKEAHIFAFEGGAICGEEGKPDAVARSLTVHVRCGEKNEIISEDEPKMCTYTMVMNSPAACDAQVLAESNLDPEGNPFKIEDDAPEPDQIVYHNEL